MDVFWDAPRSRAVWDELPGIVLAAFARCDARRLELERSRLAPRLRGAVTTPVYSVAYRFASWERLVGLLEAGGRPYFIVEYGNDLESRDVLDEVMAALPDAARGGPPGRLLAELDARFVAATAPDPRGALRPWVPLPHGRPASGLGVWWRRRPLREPWD
ncbi:hypothetical protein OG453_20240 [Streptomyces sp. NBC_01381]|uniref:hypothetical protein n=1 Tax=Streptomyces sp. NBC_01381 TaxID=2903845 RepID=UPI002252A25D|nr:hypothetical protein [Streptomyces sp. NBC_01381]MCX4668974.1 hypothetical protein [Streptomyces sp. NBC_01381]